MTLSLAWPVMAADIPADMTRDMSMPGLQGDYSMNRDASGTSWQPDATPIDGVMIMNGEWMTMLHGYAVQVYDHQGGPRGADKNFSESMFMAMASRPLGDGTFGVRAMASLDPAMGKTGYPLLLQTGETADGVEHLVDRQHPHDLFMELAAIYSHPLTDDSSGFLYVGYPGEPALGPPAFMHRASGMDIPEAPITHHWLDSTHVTFGVITLGYVRYDWKIEASAFNGREPDQFRWNFDQARLDSFSARLTWNPATDWSIQLSRGNLHSPETLDPGLKQTRTTASASYSLPLPEQSNWATTLAWGQDANQPGNRLDGFLLESEFSINDRHTLFIRAESSQNDELLAQGSKFSGQVFNVKKLSAGYIHDWLVSEHVKIGLGGLRSVYDFPAVIDSAYGAHPDSWMLFARLKLY